MTHVRARAPTPTPTPTPNSACTQSTQLGLLWDTPPCTQHKQNQIRHLPHRQASQSEIAWALNLQWGRAGCRVRAAGTLLLPPPPIIQPSHPSIAAHTCTCICCTCTSSITTKMTKWPPHRSLKTGGIWQRPGLDCSWSCPTNHIKWKRDQFVEECVQCPPETFAQDALAVAQGPVQTERERALTERERPTASAHIQTTDRTNACICTHTHHTTGEPTTLNGTAYTCRCPKSYPILRIFVYSDRFHLVPRPTGRALCGPRDGWIDTRVPIPATTVVSSKFGPLYSPVWCCNVSCARSRCSDCYVPFHDPPDIPACDDTLTYRPPAPPPGPFFYPIYEP